MKIVRAQYQRKYWRNSKTSISPTNVLEALLRGSSRFSPKLFITIKMDLWDEDLYLMQCGPPRKVWKWKNNTIILVERKKKAYESFAHDFLFKIWKKFNFGPYLKQWIRTFYTNIYIYIYIYIWITVSIQIIFCTERRVRQSDPLAPLSWAWKFSRVKLDKITT